MALVKAEASKVWTLIEGDNGSLTIASGYHRVNRLEHYITEIPFKEDIEVLYHTKKDELELLQNSVLGMIRSEEVREKIKPVLITWNYNEINNFIIFLNELRVPENFENLILNRTS